jgi:succinate dehydrogenase/fumarate reductase flavoprotein subunit
MSMHADVIVVGAGLAGMRAALAAEEAGARVVLVDRGPIGIGNNSALSNGAFSGPVSPERMPDYVSLVLQIGKGINRQASVRRIAEEASAAVAFLHSLDLDIVSPPGQWLIRSPRPEVIPGLTLVRRVADLVRQRERIRIERGFYVSEILASDRRLTGMRGFDLGGTDRELRAPAVVLACGGAGAIYAKHDNQTSILGQGYHLAARAGLALWDMEFIQCYPIVLDEPGWPMMMIYPPYPAEARLIGPAGEDVLAKHGLENINQAIIRQRDSFAALLAAEAESGPVRMDLRAVPEGRWESHPLSLLGRFKAECRTRPVRITPAVHFCMGGVRTDEDGQTDLPGLFACGEVVWGLHGANRMGGNALMECLVFGRGAGRGAAAFARAHGPTTHGDREPRAEEGQGRRPGQGGGEPALRELRTRIRDVAWRFAGVVRSAEGMGVGLTEAERIAAALAAIGPHTSKARILHQDLTSAAFALRAILTAGRGRLESRGCFIRSDYPVQDDTRWSRNSRLVWTPAADEFSVDYPPAES